MTQLTLLPAVACALIVALLAFWLFAPTKWVAKQLNAVGSAIQWFFAKFTGLFHKKAASAPVPALAATQTRDIVHVFDKQTGKYVDSYPIEKGAPILPTDAIKFPNGVIVEPVTPPTETK